MAHEDSAALSDPETDPLATYVLEPDDLRSLLARVVAGPGHATQTAHAPFTGAPVAAVPVSTAQDVARAARTARAAQRRWAVSSPRERAAVLLRVHDLLLRRQSDGLDLVQVETGQARAAAFAELVAVARVARRHGLRARRLLSAAGTAGGRPTRAGRTRYLAAGVVGVVGSAAAPLASTLGEVLVPILVGDAVLLRPDPQSTLTALWAVELAVDAGVPPDLVQVLVGSTPVATALVAVVDRLQVCGPTALVRELTGAAAQRSVPVAVSVSGPNPAYVAPDAPLPATARAVAGACFAASGPGGTAVDRVYVHERVWDAFVVELVEATRALRIEPGLHHRGEVGSLTSPAQLANVAEQVGDAVEAGARVLLGGIPLDQVGPLFYAPTILVDVPATARLAGEQAAGPVVSLIPVAGEDAAIAAMNEGRPARCARIWTSAPRHGAALAGRLRAGTVAINDGARVSTGGPLAPEPQLTGPAAVAWAGRRQTLVRHRAVHPAWDVVLGPAVRAVAIERAERLRRALRLD
jgi:succinate-semialdehyde dehydrogenase/glutarate-semialdehyde dehydrogenase